MKFLKKNNGKHLLMLAICGFTIIAAKAQTETDALMMKQNELCIAGVYAHNSWSNYWEGTLKRNNANIGSVTSNEYHLMGNYGIKNNLNVMFNVPYITTKASAGTLSGLHGFQDISFAIKWKPLSKKMGAGNLGVFLGTGFSTPLSNYVADFQPLSIGMGSTNFNGRLTVDYLVKRFFVTLSSAYIRRSNIKIDRTTYFTDRQIQSNQVAMPDMLQFNFGTGYRYGRTIAEISLANMTSLNGFDMRRNDMPFPSNRMNATMVGGNIKYNLAKLPALTLQGGASHVVAGRNFGQNTNINAGLLYIINFKKSKN
ncbi:MAG: hypothetical protein EAZ51_01195 [Sphingobacteriales bacterium]|nr:MAG: hypothetical protein EAZ64_01725 [Sphingobacteriales bacterium]TAF83166.1 MAG: hypothetical protein EAZ51_01195 [Sphingobacteriales bacterium]